MKAKYSIDKTSKTLFFIGKPQSIERSSVDRSDRDSFTSIIIPNSVSTFDQRAFMDCRTLESIHIPNSVSTISWGVFYRCPALGSIHIPNSVSTVCDCAFNNCYSLTSVHIPNSVSTIGYGAFYVCNTLASVHIPNSVSAIGHRAFHNCYKLHTVFLPTNSKINLANNMLSFSHQTSLLRPRLKPAFVLQKKSACRAPKNHHSAYL